MGLLDFLKKKKPPEIQPPAYWQETSYMVLIPRDKDALGFDDGIIDRLSGIEGANVIEFTMPHETEEGQVVMSYEGEEYNIGFFWGDFNLPKYLKHNNQFFSEDEIKAMQKAEHAITLYMKFVGEPKRSYQFQLKIALKLMPDLAGIMDESAEKLLCPRWVRQTAASSVLPSAKSLFTIQAVTRSNEVWLHTHGLARCGLPELEILGSDRERCTDQSYVITTLAGIMLDDITQNHRHAYIGRLSNGRPLVVGILPWTEGLKYYNKNILGGIKDRKEGHDSETYIIFAILSEEDENNGVYSKLTDLNDEWGSNPIFFISKTETEQMSCLAREKFDCLKTAFEDKENHIIIKLGLPTEEDREHIWFELKGFDGDSFIAELTQEPFNIPDMHEGDTGTYTKDLVTDWIVYTPNGKITPETAYLLE